MSLSHPHNPRHAETCLSRARPQLRVQTGGVAAVGFGRPENEARQERVLARLGLGGWNSSFFNIVEERTVCRSI
jgi:hypothetical protein